MRKFRGELYNSEQFVHGGYYTDGKDEYVLGSEFKSKKRHGDRSESIRFYLVKPGSVKPFTEVWDMNGCEVYGGDFVKMRNREIREVIYLDGGFHLVDKSGQARPIGSFMVYAEPDMREMLSCERVGFFEVV